VLRIEKHFTCLNSYFAVRTVSKLKLFAESCAPTSPGPILTTAGILFLLCYAACPPAPPYLKWPFVFLYAADAINEQSSRPY